MGKRISLHSESSFYDKEDFPGESELWISEPEEQNGSNSKFYPETILSFSPSLLLKLLKTGKLAKHFFLTDI